MENEDATKLPKWNTSQNEYVNKNKEFLTSSRSHVQTMGLNISSCAARDRGVKLAL